MWNSSIFYLFIKSFNLKYFFFLGERNSHSSSSLLLYEYLGELTLAVFITKAGEPAGIGRWRLKINCTSVPLQLVQGLFTWTVQPNCLCIVFTLCYLSLPGDEIKLLGSRVSHLIFRKLMGS